MEDIVWRFRVDLDRRLRPRRLHMWQQQQCVYHGGEGDDVGSQERNLESEVPSFLPTGSFKTGSDTVSLVNDKMLFWHGVGVGETGSGLGS